MSYKRTDDCPRVLNRKGRGKVLKCEENDNCTKMTSINFNFTKEDLSNSIV